MDRVATVSASSGVEYEGWKAMRSAPPPARPDVAAIPLGTQPAEPSERDLDAARQLFATDDVPVVLAVGSHEPRKNHLALLNAAELVWREGVAFALVFIGGNSWNSQDFERAVTRARTEGRLVHLVHRIEDGLLWAAYRLAYCTVFPSLQEGFGLPVAESLACGTPVITADYGSMREQSAGGGVLLANPRDDRELAAALRRILLDKDLRDKMAVEAAAAPRRSWDDYARETWAYLVDGISPERSNGR
jgi:glycosyltransferase involved in cell wall biosynthesis